MTVDPADAAPRRRYADAAAPGRSADRAIDSAHRRAARTGDEVYLDGPRISCPACYRVSYHPQDVAEGFCAACNGWTTAAVVEARSSTDVWPPKACHCCARPFSEEAGYDRNAELFHAAAGHGWCRQCDPWLDRATGRDVRDPAAAGHACPHVSPPPPAF